MIDLRKTMPSFNTKGYPFGVITDGDPFDRIDGSLEVLDNGDYDVETGEVQTRNSTILSDIMNGFNMPTGYSIMPNGLKLFSFNDPVGRQVALLFITNGSGVRIYTNTWFNPPAPNTEGGNDYENYVSGMARSGWQDEWIELTENIQLTGVVVSGGIAVNFTVTNTNLSNITDYYRGWFAWNATKWNAGSSTNLRKNHSFVCIEAWDSATKTFNIQERTGLHLSDLGWNSGDKIYLIRYPIVVHKGNDITDVTTDLRMNFDSVQLVKTNISVKCLIGQEGGLWFGFVNKDTTKLSSGTILYSQQNNHKYYGWWLDYETIPVMPDTTFLDWNSGNPYTYTFSPIYGIGFLITWVNHGVAANRMPLVAFELCLDGYQYIALAKGTDHSAIGSTHAPSFALTVHHAYSRRITRLIPYGLTAETGNALIFEDDPEQVTGQGWGEVFTTNANVTRYSIFYDYSNTLYTAIAYLQLAFSNSLRFEANLGYSVREQIYIKSTFGVFSQGRMFINDIDKPDSIRYSLFQKEDIFALQNSRPIDAVDKDRNMGIDLLGVNPAIAKNNSWHIISIEGETDANWRLIDVKGRIGCPYPRSIVRTPYGLMFANDFGIWLLDSTNEPTNIIRSRRLQAYLAIVDKSVIYGEWYSLHNEAWFYIGNNTFWICKLSKEEKQIGWKTYTFNFAGDYSPIDTINDDDNNFYIVTIKKLIRYINDNEISNGKDANDTDIVFNITGNFNKLNDSVDKFHWIETNIRYETESFGGRSQNIRVKLYDQQNNVVKDRTYAILNSGNIILRNGLSDNQRAIKSEISGTLSGAGRLKIQEIDIRVKPLQRPIKSGYAKVG